MEPSSHFSASGIPEAFNVSIILELKLFFGELVFKVAGNANSLWLSD